MIVIADIAAEDWPANWGDNHRHRPQRERDGAFGGRIVVQQQTLRQRNQRPGDNPLDDAEENQHRQATGHAAGPGGQHEQDRRPKEQLHFTDALRQPAGDGNGDGVRHPERGNDPGPLAQR